MRTSHNKEKGLVKERSGLHLLRFVIPLHTRLLRLETSSSIVRIAKLLAKMLDY